MIQRWFNHMHPWIMLVLSCGILYLMVGYWEPMYPLEHKWTFYIPLVWVTAALIGIVWASFRVRAIFDRSDRNYKRLSEMYDGD